MKNEQTMELIRTVESNVFSNTASVAWIIRQIRLCGEMYEAAAARNRCLSGAVSERFERAAGIPGYGHTLPDSLEDVRWSAECACGCTASSVRTIRSRSYTTFTNMFHTHAGSCGKEPWDDVLSHTDELQRYILAAADFEDNGDIDGLPFEVFEALDELWEIAYLCGVLCAL